MKTKLTILLSLLISINSFSQTFSFDWAVRVGNSLNSSGYSVVTDANNNVYTIGQFSGSIDLDPGAGTMNVTSNGGQDFFISKLDANGNFIWGESFGGSANDFGWSINLDLIGNVLITGSFQDTVDFDPGVGVSNQIAVAFLDIFILKLNSSGDLIWARSIGNDQSEVGVSVNTDSNNNVFVVGDFAGTVDFDPSTGTNQVSSNGISADMFFIKLDANGNFVWVKTAGGTSSDESRSISIDNNDNIYILGNYQGTIDLDPGLGTINSTSDGSYDIFVQKFDTNGDLLWAKSYGGTDIDQGLSADIDINGNIYITGYFLGTIDLDPGSTTQNYTATGGSSNIFIQKLDSNGDFIWGNVIASLNGGEQSRNIVVSDSGEVFVTGYAGGTIDFDSGVGVYNLVSNGGYDIFILNLDSLGNFVWAENFGASSQDYPRSITLDNLGNILLTGDFQDTVDFDAGPTTFDLIANGADYFLLKLQNKSSQPLEITKINSEQSIILYPNPASTYVQIESNKLQIERYSIVDIYGKTIKQSKIPNSKFKINIESLSNGIYFIKLKTKKEIVVKKFIKL